MCWSPPDTGSPDTGKCHKGNWGPPPSPYPLSPPGAAQTLSPACLVTQPDSTSRHTEGSVGGGGPQLPPPHHLPECGGHTNSMICIIPVNKMSPCAGGFVQKARQPFFQPAPFHSLPFCYSYYKCVIEFRKLYDGSSGSVLSLDCIF